MVYTQQNTCRVDAVRTKANNEQSNENNIIVIIKFLKDFKNMFPQLIQQNSMILKHAHNSYKQNSLNLS